MPLYEYACRKCHKHTERIEKYDGPHLRKCPSCGGSVERLISAPAIQFKGSGWYVTDYARGSGAGDKSRQSNSSSDKSEGKSEGKSEAKAETKNEGKSDAKTETKSAESKPSPSSEKKKGASKEK